MIQLSVNAAFNYVKRVLDELVSTEEIGMIADPDSLDLYKMVEGSMVESVSITHSMSPALLVDGIIAKDDEDYTMETKDGVSTITMNVPVLRLASLKMSDSEHIITSAVPEDSPEGRMQLNEFVRGTYDDPSLVMQKISNGDHKPIYKYYSHMGAEVKPSVSLEYIPYPVLENGIVEISPKLEYPTLDMIVSLVLGYLSETEKAQFYREKSIKSMGGE